MIDTFGNFKEHMEARWPDGTFPGWRRERHNFDLDIHYTLTNGKIEVELRKRFHPFISRLSFQVVVYKLGVKTALKCLTARIMDNGGRRVLFGENFSELDNKGDHLENAAARFVELVKDGPDAVERKVKELEACPA